MSNKSKQPLNDVFFWIGRLLGSLVWLVACSSPPPAMTLLDQQTCVFKVYFWWDIFCWFLELLLNVGLLLTCLVLLFFCGCHACFALFSVLLFRHRCVHKSKQFSLIWKLRFLKDLLVVQIQEIENVMIIILLKGK